ncbi:hypothetical protein HDU96_010672, partial [Phlyctochytrium bullatum]
MSPRITSALFHLAHAGLTPHPTTIASALAHIAFFNPQKLLDYLELATPRLEDLPVVVTILAYLNRSALIATILTQLRPPGRPRTSHTHRIAAA